MFHASAKCYLLRLAMIYPPIEAYATLISQVFGRLTTALVDRTWHPMDTKCRAGDKLDWPSSNILFPCSLLLFFLPSFPPFRNFTLKAPVASTSLPPPSQVLPITMLAITALSAALLAAASTAHAADHTIVVGGSAGLVFTPPSINAEVGDLVTFIFSSKNHTVTQSGFASPCTLLQNATINVWLPTSPPFVCILIEPCVQAVGFDSDFVPVGANATEFPAWTIEVTAKTPIWFYCKQGNHCQQGMVGSINAATTGNKTL